MQPKRGLINPEKRFRLEDTVNECCWFFSADEVQVAFFKLERFSDGKQQGSKHGGQKRIDAGLSDVQRNDGKHADD